MTDGDELVAGATALGISLDSEQLEKLLKFGALLARWNGAFNLVSRRDMKRLVPRHLLDSLSLATFLRGARIADLGTGAGLPGLPLAIVRPQLSFTLVDRNQRRIRFVQQVVFELGLTNVEGVASDFVRFRPGALFDTVLSRAVTTAAALWRVSAPLLAPGGQALFLVGANDDGSLTDAASVERVDIQIPGLSRSHRLLRLAAALPVEETDR